MTHEYAPAAYPHGEEAAVRKRVEGGDVFIGPSYDVVNDTAVPLLAHQAEDLARIYEINPVAFTTAYPHFRESIALHASGGALRLADRYEQMSFDQQVDAYARDAFEMAKLLNGTVEAQDAHYEEAINTNAFLNEELQKKAAEIEEMKKSRSIEMIESTRQLLRLRYELVTGGGTEAQISAVDAIIMAKTESEPSTEKSESDTDRFRKIASQFGHLALDGANRAFNGAKQLVATMMTPYETPHVDTPSSIHTIR